MDWVEPLTTATRLLHLVLPETGLQMTSLRERLDRRAFCSGVAAAMWAAVSDVRAGQSSTPPASSTRPDVAAIDHDRILSLAKVYVAEKPVPITSLPSSRSPGTPHDYYSEAAPSGQETAAVSAFIAHRDALFKLALQVPGLAAAYLLTQEARFAEAAAGHLRAWFVDPATRMNPSLEYGQVPFAETAGRPRGGTAEGMLETLPLVEIAQAIPFLADSGALTPPDLKTLYGWFREYLGWLIDPQDSGPRLAALARDRKDHHGTSWLLQVTAYTLLTVPTTGAPKAEDKAVAELRHRYKTSTVRAQIGATGSFPHELTSATPYRDSLFNLDMMACLCDLLSTRFERLWDFQLEDGPGMRAAIAYHFPFMEERSRWPFRADVTHFNELPARRISLLLAARAYQRPEYAALWTSLKPDLPSADVQRTIPVHQPLLWVRQPPRSS